MGCGALAAETHPMAPMSAPRVLDWDHAVPEGDLKLSTVIVYNGPGTWTAAAGWDEYVVTITNPGQEELRIESAKLTDVLGQPQLSGPNPRKLTLLSRDNYYKYRDEGLKLRTGAGTLGAGDTPDGPPAVVAAKTGLGFGLLVAELVVPGFGLFALPASMHLNASREKEFARRCLVLPLTIAPGATVKGSLFFPVTPGPKQLALVAHSGSVPTELTLDLKLLADLHFKPAKK
jgi:hypothetical protein